MDDADVEVVERLRAAMLAVAMLAETLEEQDADESHLDACDLAQEALDNLACDLGFGVVNGVLVPR